MSQLTYDLAVIGAGIGGYQAAIRAAQYGAKVALIEENELGGTCLNRGCIPAKALFASAAMVQRLETHGEDFGIEATNVTLNFAKAVERKNKVVKELTEGISKLLKAWKIDLHMGHGKILSGNLNDGFEIFIEGHEGNIIKAKRVIIATGSSPAIIPDFKIDHERILTSDDVFDPNFKIVPKRLLIIGAGIIGCEFANIFASFGSKVTMLEYLPSALATEEPMVIKELMKKFRKQGIEIHVSQNVLSLENTGSTVKAVTCSADVSRDQIENAKKFTYEAEYCFVSIGREKRSNHLGLEDIGIKTDRGFIIVNRTTLETKVKGIYAIGDVTGGNMLAHVASYEGSIAVTNALASLKRFPVESSRTDYAVVPITIFTSPNIGSVGLRRKTAKDKGFEVLIGRFPYASLGKAKCSGEEEGFILILADRKTEKIIGASCIGAEAPELISEIAVAMQNGLTVDNISSTIHSHPTFSEMVFEGVEDVLGLSIHKKSRPILRK